MALALAPLLGPGQAGVVDAAPAGCTSSGGVATCTFSYTGAAQNWTVLDTVTQATFDVYGAQGGPGENIGGPLALVVWVARQPRR